MQTVKKTVLKMVAATVLTALLIPFPYFILLQRMTVKIMENLPFFLEHPREDVIVLGACFIDWIVWLGYAVAFTALLLVLLLRFFWRELKKLEGA